MRTLVVTGDDFGASVAVNRGIAESYDRGILTSASLMVCGDAADDAVALAKARPGLSVGLHLVLVDGRAATSPKKIPHLVHRDGWFRGGPFRAGLRYQFSRAARRELLVEIRSQFESFERTGLKLAHLDGHHHLHLHPVVLDLVTRPDITPLPIPSIRLPSEELRVALALDPGKIVSKVVTSAVFRLLRRNGERRLSAAGIGYAERVYGLLATGRLTERYLLGLIPEIRAKRVEIYGHPAASHTFQECWDPSPSGLAELAAFTSPWVQEAIARAGFASTSEAPLEHSTASGVRRA